MHHLWRTQVRLPSSQQNMLRVRVPACLCVTFKERTIGLGGQMALVRESSSPMHAFIARGGQPACTMPISGKRPRLTLHRTLGHLPTPACSEALPHARPRRHA
jgi:hypothetical protein